MTSHPYNEAAKKIVMSLYLHMNSFRALKRFPVTLRLEYYSYVLNESSIDVSSSVTSNDLPVCCSMCGLMYAKELSWTNFFKSVVASCQLHTSRPVENTEVIVFYLSYLFEI